MVVGSVVGRWPPARQGALEAGRMCGSRAHRDWHHVPAPEHCESDVTAGSDECGHQARNLPYCFNVANASALAVDDDQVGASGVAQGGGDHHLTGA